MKELFCHQIYLTAVTNAYETDIYENIYVKWLCRYGVKKWFFAYTHKVHKPRFTYF